MATCAGAAYATGMSVSAQVRRHYDDRAGTYDDNEMHTGLTKVIANWLDMGGDEVVLDVATGTGLVLRSLAERWPALRTIGIDISPAMLALAQQRTPGASFVRADAVVLPIAEASVDLVTCVTALHLMPDPLGVTEEWRRVLRPSGRVVTATFIPPDGHVEPNDGVFRNHAGYVSPAPFEALGWPVVRSMTWAYETDTVLICELQRMHRV